MATGVLVDANVLYSRTVRDWLFLLRNASCGSMFTVHTTEDILAEVLYHLRRNHPTAPGQMIANIHDRLVVQIDDRITDFDVGPYPGPDPNDAHVHAAAVASGAAMLLTADSGFLDLPDDVLATLPYEVHHPDSFLVLFDDSAPHLVRTVTREQLAYWMKRDGEADLPGRLRSAGCPEFARRVRDHIFAG